MGHIGGGEHGHAEARPDEPGEEVRAGHFEGDIAAEPGGVEGQVGRGASGRSGRKVHEHLGGEPAQVDLRFPGPTSAAARSVASRH
ncbi:hypothetical protein ADL28_15145 [Streptomyces violaceusniger]|uniref:Uncharacterized protein n=1 Tax=Streptomyces violaceusniger TaxID=68280 RepID=A0A0X3WY66_STRVO|nr:hypothetical protein ADL28_15145 [Streptomyces violaceusniger]